VDQERQVTPDRWATIERLYHAALARPSEQRAPFLADACAGDDELRHEVESLLARSDSAEHLLTEGAAKAAAALVSDVGRSVLTGRRLGAYQILAPIGAGGMGEVYRARDTRLGRDVAIKILPRAFTADADRLARFEREARVLASLNHPHIAAIYGIEDAPTDAGGQARALVLELVEGETLAGRIGRSGSKGLPIKEALDIARQIVDALDAAHEKGIVHRDLKPANIKIAPQGIVKVLDFGLAKLEAGGADKAGGEFTEAPTITVDDTREGLVVGTAAYMSPEQARGQAVDKRTDIWAFGCVLYEMLTGRSPFARSTTSDTIAAVLDRDPAWDALPSTVPPAVHRLLRLCLEKDPARRLRDAGDIRIEIDDALANKTPESLSNRPAASRPIVKWLALVAVVVAAVSASWRWINSSREADSASEQRASRFSIQFPPDSPMIGGIGVGSQIALSPDGGSLVFTARAVEGINYLYLRRLDQLESRRIPGTEGAVDPFFSTDGEWVGFFAGRKLMRVALSGGPPQTICELDTPAAGSGATWSSDGTILFAKTGAGLWRVPSAGGVPTAVTRLNDRETNHAWPEVLPGGKAVLFDVQTDSGGSQIYAQSLETGERRAIGPGVGAHYLTSGHVVYGVGSSLFAVPFDAARLQITGTPARVVDNIFSKRGAGAGAVLQAAISRTGALVFIPATPPLETLVWVDRIGNERALNLPSRSYVQPRLAPDEHRLAVMIAREDASLDVWLWDLSRETLSRLTDDGGHNYLLWTPDGHRLSFLSNSGPIASGSRGTITWKRVDDSSAAVETLLTGQTAGAPLSWTPDGRILAFVNLHPVTRQDIWILALDGKAQPRPFLQTRFAEGGPAFSPDGRWLAYVSDESGRSEVYVQPFPGPGEKIAVSTDGGYEITWPRRGHELFYRSGDSMMAVDVTTGATFTAGKPRRLFDRRFERSTAVWPNYDVTADGQRFIMVKSAEEFTSPRQMTVVLNWDQELKRLLPTR
jgi:serine/threonine-protein kinase